MSVLTAIAARLEADPVTDLVVGGYVDREDGRARFHPKTDSVYLVCGEQMLRFLAGRDDYVVIVDVVAAVTRDFPIDPDDEFCVASLFTLLLGDAYTDRRVDRFRATRAPGGEGEANVIGGCELGFEDGEVLTIEPMVPSGLRIASSGRGHDASEPGGADIFSWRRGIGWTGAPR